MSSDLEKHSSWDIIDSTKLEEYASCPRQYFYKRILGWLPDTPAHDLEFGKAVHLSMRHLLERGYTAEALQEAYDLFEASYRQYYGPETDLDYEPKNPFGVARMLKKYIVEYSDDDFEVLHTEVAGSIPILDDRIHFKMDSILLDKRMGQIISLEHKTGKTLSRQWMDKWSLAFQTGTYNHVLHCMYPSDKVWGVKINGLFFQKKEIKLQRVPARRSMEMLNVWLYDVSFWASQMRKDIKFLVEEDWPQRGELDVMFSFMRNPTNCTKYFGCPYLDFCSSWSNPLHYIEDVPSGFKVEYWDPRVQEENAGMVFHYKSEERG